MVEYFNEERGGYFQNWKVAILTEKNKKVNVDILNETEEINYTPSVPV